MARIEEHTVAAGETLWDITGKYYTDPNLYPELAKANGIADPDRISPGQKIKLPTALYRANEVSFSPDQVTIDLGVARRICDCDKPEENYPYDDDTFAMIARIKDLILKASEQHGVPPVAVAGSIADEYNTRRGLKAGIDWIQDEFWIHTFTNNQFRIAAILDRESKLFNATKHDLGIGNIKLETAAMIFNQFPETFEAKAWDYKDLVDYIQTDGGTCHIAALVIKYGWDLLAEDVADLPLKRMEAVLVTFYKQGEETYIEKKWKPRKAKDPTAQIRPGEGCRVCLQRERICKALGIK